MNTSLRLWPAALLLFALVFPATARAHCDTLDGPVVSDARLALRNGDVTPVLKWVTADDEAEIHAVFEHALAVRSLGPEARELADTYFFESLVRIHRASENAPFDGLKPAGQVDPPIAMADKALATGSAEELTSAVTGHLAAGIETRFHRAVEARRHAGDSVAAGRDFVAAYVEFTHFIEALHEIAAGAASHSAPASHAGHAEHP